jgi:hypothetical protein
MNNLYLINPEDYLTIMEEAIKLGKERGKKEGDNIEQEFFEVAKKKGKLNNIKHLGQTEMDKDLLLGNLREEGIKIFNLDEEKRRKDEL